MKAIRSIFLTVCVACILAASAVAQTTGGVKVQVMDLNNAIIPGATVIVVDAAKKEKSCTTDKTGECTVSDLVPGKYIIRVVQPKFQLFEATDVDIPAGDATVFPAILSVANIKENVNINADQQVSTEPMDNKNGITLKDTDLDALPDDPDEIAEYLQMLAGSAAGPDGGQIYIDGFTGGRMPPKEAIREVRINQNPFSAEYDRVGFSRIEILTKPGFDKLRGSANFNFNDATFNSRNPFSANRAPGQRRNYGGFLSGPIQAKKSSFFLDINERENDTNSVVTAILLDPSANVVNFNQDFKVPTRNFSISPRVDFTINKNNFANVRYSFTRSKMENQGIGGVTLPSRASNSSGTENEVQFSESMIINPKTVNETRFQIDMNRNDQTGDNSIPSVSVSQSFSGGGAQVGHNYTHSNRWEFQNYTTTSLGKASQHAIKFGVRVRGISIDSRSESGYGGSFSFSGYVDNNGTPDDTSDDTVITPIEQFRQKVLGNLDPIYNPTQFSLTTGNPLAKVSQVDYGPFFTDDWKVRPDLTLSFGLRYENQTNLHDNTNWAPRFGFAYAPKFGNKPAKTVFRGGFGLFYDRFSENNTLRALRNNGTNQLQYVVTSNIDNILGQAVFAYDGSVSNVPTAAQLATFAPQASVPFLIASDLQSPVSYQSALSVEHQLPWNSTISATYTFAKTEHTLRMRDINAPVCPNTTVCPSGLNAADQKLYIDPLRPDPTKGNITQVESSGYAYSQMLRIGFMSRLTTRSMISAGYIYSIAKGDSDSFSSPQQTVNAVGFPAYSYDFHNEYAVSTFIPRHQFYVTGSLTLPWNIRLSPTVTTTSARAFNITTGFDTNYDGQYTERPTYAQVNARCEELHLTYSYCSLNGVSDPNATIPRNYGKGFDSFVTNLNFSKTFGFGKSKASAAQNSGNRGNRNGGNSGGRQGGGMGGGMMGGGMGGPGGGGPGGGRGGFFGGGDNTHPYNLTFGVNVQNLFNNVNFNSPSGSLTSSVFGQPRSTSGGFGGFGGGGGGGSANRRVDLSLRFSF